MMANGQQLQPMHALFPPSIPHGLSSLCSWEQVKVNRSTCTHHIQVSEDNMANAMPVVFIHYPYSNPHPPQMGRVWVENNYPLKKWGG
jgi:hypothetical protein